MDKVWNNAISKNLSEDSTVNQEKFEEMFMNAIKAVDLEGEIDVSVMDAIEKYVKVIEEDND